MPAALIHAIFANIVLPELSAFLAARRAAGQPPPTKEELLAEMHARAAVIIAAGEAFLKEKGAL